MKKKRIPSPADVRRPLTICILIGIFMLALYTVLTTLTEIPPIIIGIASTVLYIYSAIFSLVLVKNKLKKIARELERADAFNKELSQMFDEVVELPYVVVAPDGHITATNSALDDLLSGKLSHISRVEDFCSATLEEIIKASEPDGQLALDLSKASSDKIASGDGLRVTIRRRKYVAFSYPMAVQGNDCHMVTFTDITTLVSLEDKTRRENPIVALVVIDNLEEIAQYVRVSYRAAANEIEAILKKWVTDMDGIIREYDRDKYVLFISQEKLEECVKNKFEILDSIRDVRLGDDNMSVTVSMGIFAGSGTLAAREAEASNALDLALGRGGDQVALRREGADTEYFGGKSKSIHKRTRVRSRVHAGVLCNKISEASNVLVMGHKNPDFDCIGACIGMARLAMYCGVPVKIVSDLKSESLATVQKKLSKYDEYRDMFVDALAGIDLVRPETLLIICDANNFKIIEAPEIADNVDKIAIIDHHRQMAKFDFEPLVNYIDPAASSACELVSEILEQSMPNGTLQRDEATAMLAGIMLDTKHFSKETGPRTFSAALYLQNEGAKPEQARAFFEENIDEFLAEAKFSRNIQIYRDNIAITRSSGTGSVEYDRTAASKAADKLLSVRQVEAAFALVQTGDSIRISARSSGKINVQLILEQLGGGGHFEAAGAQLDGAMDKAVEVLIAAIDKYLEDN